MVTIKGKIRPIGNSYHILIPKALVKCEALPLDKELQFKVIMPLLFKLVIKSGMAWLENLRFFYINFKTGHTYMANF